MKDLKIGDCDGHVAEPFSLYREYCEPEFRDRAPRRVERDGQRYVVVDGVEHPNFVKYGGRPLGMENDAKIERPVQDEKIHEGGYDPHVRLKDMDIEGIDVAVIYPSGATSLCAIENAELEAAMYRAYNRWLAEYCSPDPVRLKGNVLVSIRHPEEGRREILRVVDEPWVAGVLITTHIDDYNLDHPRFDPIYEVAQAHDLPVCFHAGAGRPPYAMGTDESSRNLFLMHAFAHPFEMMRAMGSLMGGGVLDRFPKLRTGFIECAIGWVPWWLDRLLEHRNNLPHHVPLMKREPLEYVAGGQVFVNAIPRELALEPAVELLGDGWVVFGSDYPHWDSDYDGIVARMRRRKLPEESLRRIFWDNAVKLHPRIAEIEQRWASEVA